ncbi:MAG TPA: PH domain-containing protein, partial [Nocardioides sp.]
MSTPEVPDVPEVPDAPVVPDAEWQRLAGWTAVVSPLSTLRQAIIPAAIGAFTAGQANVLIGLLVAVGIAVIAALAGMVPWLTTSYRVTPTHLEVRKGLLNRTTLTARLDRVRSVDLSSTLIHRALGVTKVNVGTGVDEGQITLDSLTKDAAARLRRELLHAAPAPSASDVPSAEGPSPETGPVAASPEGETIAKLDWSWIRYAPLNLKNLAIAVGGLGAVFGAFSDLIPWGSFGVRVTNGEVNGVPVDEVVRMLFIAIPIAIVGAAAVW